MTKIGVIIESRGLYYKVQDKNNNVHTCVIRGKIRLLDKKDTAPYGRLTNPVAVGDYVKFAITDGLITQSSSSKKDEKVDFATSDVVGDYVKFTITDGLITQSSSSKKDEKVDFATSDFLKRKDSISVITNILSRKNCLVRKHPLKKNYNQIIASNVDIAVLVSVFVSESDIYSHNKQIFYIDKFLVAAEYFGIFPVLVFNKIDLLSKQDKIDLQNLCKIYNDIGYDTMAISTMQYEDINNLKTFLISRSYNKNNDSDIKKLETVNPSLTTMTSNKRNGMQTQKEAPPQLSFTKILFTGNSGVGKSTIINNLTGRNMKTGVVSNRTQKGRHTTTCSVMAPINNDTYIIDTPGIRSLFPSDLGKSRNIIQKYDLAFCFPEIKFLLPCKFNNCTHIHEPGCKVIAAIKNGRIADSRYENYKKILELI